MTEPEDTETTFRLMYRSHNLVPADDRRVALGALFTQARSNNKGHGVTGALLLTSDWFVQVLEGAEVDVRSIFASIERDPRHDSVEVIETRAVDSRVFARWSMARIAGDGQADIPLIAHTDGIAAAAGRPVDAAQDAVLQRMRDAAAVAASQVT